MSNTLRHNWYQKMSLEPLDYLRNLINIKDKLSLDSFVTSCNEGQRLELYRITFGMMKYIYSFDHDKIVSFFGHIAENLHLANISKTSLAKIFDEFLAEIKSNDLEHYTKVVNGLLQQANILYLILESSAAEQYYDIILNSDDFENILCNKNARILFDDDRFTEMLTRDQILCSINFDIYYFVKLSKTQSKLIKDGTKQIDIKKHISANFIESFHVLVEWWSKTKVDDCEQLFMISMDEISRNFRYFGATDEFHTYISGPQFERAIKILIKSPSVRKTFPGLVKVYKKLFISFVSELEDSGVRDRYLCEAFEFLIDDSQILYGTVKLFFPFFPDAGGRTVEKYTEIPRAQQPTKPYHLDYELIIELLGQVENKNVYYHKVVNLLILGFPPRFSHLVEYLNYSDLVFLSSSGLCFEKYCVELYNGRYWEKNEAYKSSNFDKLHFLIYSLATINKTKELVVRVKKHTKPIKSRSSGSSSSSDSDSSSSSGYCYKNRSYNKSYVDDEIIKGKGTLEDKPVILSYKKQTSFPKIGKYIQNKLGESSITYGSFVFPKINPFPIFKSPFLNNVYFSYARTEFPYPRPLINTRNAAVIIHSMSRNILYSPPEPNSETSTWRCGYSLTYCQNKYRTQSSTVEKLYSAFEGTSICFIYNINSVTDFETLLKLEVT